MTGFDIAFVIVLVLSLGLGYLRGIMRELASLLVLTVAVVATLTFGDVLAPMIGGGSLGDIGSHLIVFAATFLIAAIALEIVAHRFLPSGRRPLDRSLGAAFGLVRGWVVMGLVYLSFISYFDPDDLPRFLQDAALRSVAAGAADTIDGLGFDRRVDWTTGETNGATESALGD